MRGNKKSKEETREDKIERREENRGDEKRRTRIQGVKPKQN